MGHASNDVTQQESLHMGRKINVCDDVAQEVGEQKDKRKGNVSGGKKN